MKIVKRATKILCLIVLMTFPVLTVYAAEEVTVFVNGKQVVSEVPAVIVNNSTMLPFRAIYNALGVSDEAITWNERSKSIEVSYNGNYIFLVIGNRSAIYNDRLITLNQEPYIERGRTLVPVRFVSETLGAKVDWDETTKTVTITL